MGKNVRLHAECLKEVEYTEDIFYATIFFHGNTIFFRSGFRLFSELVYERPI